MEVYYVGNSTSHAHIMYAVHRFFKKKAKDIYSLKEIRKLKIEEQTLFVVSPSFDDTGNLISYLSRNKNAYLILLSDIRENSVISSRMVSLYKTFSESTLQGALMEMNLKEKVEKEEYKKIFAPCSLASEEKNEYEIFEIDEELEEICGNIITALNIGAPVLLTGEIGTGKTTLARLIAKKLKKEEHFVNFDCGAHNQINIEDHLFGHVKGAFTDARTSRNGLALEADGGILFIDEIQDFPLDMQAKLLRLVEEKKIRQIGSDKDRKVKTSLIFATSASSSEIKKLIRKDLYSRIGPFIFKLPEIKGKSDTIRKAIEFNQKRMNREFYRYEIKDYSPWLKYSWPGNYRQLKSAVEYYVVYGKMPEDITSAIDA
ncbi:MAG TPA: sigma 54-interacting transcriptional regulator [Candidatus Ornithospirochaeta avicola]|uniref:Sigma 54-interacting transcriptional regulator n=1 Tax=Candidatus Ornithospirochaeta avicola TaxID=2840896 RepID=A0A9D1PT44_9SPIO|nr:sigma 54-interacting transcriptional regulator [Candidatus Ornithospirochaeta avicola]